MNRNITVIVCICLSSQAFSQAQQFKVGVFDIMVQAIPSYRSSVDSMLQVYANDSLAQEYNFYQQEYVRGDSSYKVDSVLKSRKVF